MMHLSDDQLILHFYGEGPDRRGIDDHLRSCEEGGRRYSDMTRILSAVEAPPVPERGAAYPAGVWQAVEQRLQSRQASPRMSWFRLPRLALAGSVAALVILAFLVGRWSDGPSRDPITPEARDRILLVAVGDHLERSQRLLIELVNTGEPAGTDISSQQVSARSLALNNRLYRQTAGRAGQDDIVALLEELESLLLEVANGPSQPAQAELAAMQRRIASRGLVMRIHLLGERARIDSGQSPRRTAAARAAELEL
jgi:hypothetical protein